jgi:lipopolysaccharide transport system ATP-binding protein
MQPEILVIDEVLAVGDATFQEKCFHALAELKSRGATILFVSHDAGAVRSFCDRAALLVAGHLLDIGPAADVVDHYERLLRQDEPRATLLRVRAVDALGFPLDTVASGADVRLEALIRTPGGAATNGLTLQLDLFDESGTHLFGTQGVLPAALPPASQASQRPDDAPDTRVAGGVIRSLPVTGGTLRVVATLLDARGDARDAGPERGEWVVDRRETVLSVEPSGPGQRGLLALDHCWSWEVPDQLAGDVPDRQSAALRR